MAAAATAAAATAKGARAGGERNPPAPLTGTEVGGLGHVDGHFIAETGDVRAEGFVSDLGEGRAICAPSLPHSCGAIVRGGRSSEPGGCAEQQEDCEAPHGWV